MQMVGFFPGAIYYLSYWYTRREFGKRMGIFWSCRCLAGGIGGLFAYGVSYISNTQIHVWQWYVTMLLLAYYSCIQKTEVNYVQDVYHTRSPMCRIGGDSLLVSS